MVGAHLSLLYRDEEERGKFLSVITDAEWGIQLGRLGVSAELTWEYIQSSIHGHL